MPNMMKARYLRVKLLRLFDSRAGCPCGGGGLGRDEQEAFSPVHAKKYHI